MRSVKKELNNSPAISVIMPTYNTPIQYLKEAVDSILNQTFTDFEFLIIDDYSTDESVGYLSSLKDKRIKIIRNDKNLGITKSLNIGLKEAKGKYIARMDADDISLPSRLEKQFDFMENNQNVIVCGTWTQILNNNNELIEFFCPTIDDIEFFKASLLFGNYGPAHPSVIMNAELFHKNQIIYDERFENSQDYALWIKCIEYGDIKVIKEPLLKYRVHDGQVSKNKVQIQKSCAKKIREKLLKKLINDDSINLIDHHEIMINEYNGICNEIKWYRYLLKENRRNHIYNQNKFKEAIEELIINKAHFYIKNIYSNNYIKQIKTFICIPINCKIKILFSFYKKRIKK